MSIISSARLKRPPFRLWEVIEYRPASGRLSPLPDIEIGGVEGSSWRLCVLASRQAHREHRPFARLARHRHVAAHHSRELAREGKSETRAAEALRGHPIGLAELLEQLGLLLRSHANAGVSDRELDPAASVEIGRASCRERGEIQTVAT